MKKLATEARISLGTARVILKQASQEQRERSERELSGGMTRAFRAAERVRDNQIDQADRIEALTERALADLEAQAESGQLSIRDLETLSRLRDRHWQHVKDMAGINVAEKIAVAQARGEATGKGFAGALLDSTTIDIGEGVWEIGHLS